MPAPRQQLIDLITQGAIPPDKLESALLLSQVTPNAQAWRRFLDLALLWLSLLALACSVIFFIAYNWTALGRFAKFGLVELAIILCLGGYWKLGAQTLAGKVTLLVASLLLGALLALYGQTYQTGADTWQLFFSWALLILPWVLIGRFAALWILWLALINLSISLYYEVRHGLFGMLVDSETTILWLIFAFNLFAWVIWESLAHVRGWLAERWAIRLIAIASGIPLCSLMLYAIFENQSHNGPLTTLIWLCWLVALYGVYTRIVRDLFMLAGGSLTVIVVVVAFLSNHLFAGGDHAFAFLFIALVLIGLAAAVAVWLRKLHRAWQT
jgi:uncharacterized membrane protein